MESLLYVIQQLFCLLLRFLFVAAWRKLDAFAPGLILVEFLLEFEVPSGKSLKPGECSSTGGGGGGGRFRAWLETFLIGREQVLDGLREFVLVSVRAILFPGSLGVAIPDCG